MNIKNTRIINKLSKLSLAYFWVLLYYLPFHAFITTWVISGIGHELIVKSFKDVLTLSLFGFVTVLVLLKDKTLFKKNSTPINILILAYIVLTTLYMNVGSVDRTARYYGLLVNTRFFLFFITSQQIALLTGITPNGIYKHLLKYIARIGLILASFGIFQLFMPDHFMRYFGYEEGFLSPIFTLDSQADIRRVASTMRGPNPLGIFLVLIITGMSEGFTKLKDLVLIKHRGAVLTVALSSIVLFYTYSRSAWIGLIISLGILVLIKLKRLQRLVFLSAATLGVVLLFSLIAVLRDTAFVQRTVFHTDIKNESKIAKSDEVHLDSLHNALQKIQNQPNGCGTGCSGPATFRNTSSPQNIPENYYLQITQEVGFVGVSIFILIVFLVFWKLYLLHDDPLGLILMTSFAGISISGLFLHVWTDDTIAYVWWGLAGLFIGSYSHSGSLTASAKRPDTSVQEISEQSI